MTPLHRAAYLAHYEGYLEIYEYLLSRGADPTVLTEDYDPYLNPGRKLPIDVAVDKPEVRAKLAELEKRYARTAKAKTPHEDIGDWWALYDYGLEAIKNWTVDYKPPYPEELKREKDEADRKKAKAERKARRALLESGALQEARPVPKTPVAFLFPGQGSQKVGMGSECMDLPEVQAMFATAEKVLGYDLKDVCLNGPKEKLDQTEFAQPALFVCGLAALEKLKKEDPGAVKGLLRRRAQPRGVHRAGVRWGDELRGRPQGGEGAWGEHGGCRQGGGPPRHALDCGARGCGRG